MSEKEFGSRRGFLKKAVVTAGVTGGVLTNAQTVAAASQSITVDGYQGGGEYRITVNDSNASGGSDLESGDTIENGASSSRLSGTVGDGDTDTFHFDGQVTGMYVEGNLDVAVNNPNGSGLHGELRVEGDNTDYALGVTDSLTAFSDCESNDEVSGNTVNGSLDGSDVDTYGAEGTIEFVQIPGSWVTFQHDI